MFETGMFETVMFESFMCETVMIETVMCETVTVDLSKSVPMVFRSPGNPLIHLFRVILNSKCHFLKVSFFIELQIAISYWPMLFPCGRTGPCYSLVEATLSNLIRMPIVTVV